MNRGILIYAHNNEIINYVELAKVSAKLAKEQLNYPVSLISDSESLSSVTDVTIFDKIITIEKPELSNKRSSNGKISSFLNSNRNTAWDLTPYDHTLIIDADYFVFTNKLNEYWDIDQSFLISPGSNFFLESNSGYLDKYVSYQGIPMKWATTIMFKKNNESKLYFDLVNIIRQEYLYFNLLYNFNPRLYRNDIAFSIADHILNGHLSASIYYLPTINSVAVNSKILHIDKNFGVKILFDVDKDPYVIDIKNSDVHFMNKEDLIKHITVL
jgi:hypothetical protein